MNYRIINFQSYDNKIKDLEAELYQLELVDKKLRDKSWDERFISIEVEISILKKILNDSIPLDLEIRRAIDTSIKEFECNAYEVPEIIEKIINDYIANLKLSI
jgi:hypothetical protein